MSKNLLFPPRGLASLVIACLFLGISAAQVHATPYYWAVSPGVLGGSGTWSTSDPNWTTTNTGGGTHVVWPNVNTNTANFGGADGTYAVTLGTTPMTINSMLFTSSGYTLSAASASTLAYGGTSPVLSIASTKTVTIGNNVTLSGAAYNIIGGGTVIFESGSTLAATSTLAFGSTSDFDTTVELRTGSSVTISGSISGSANGTFNLTGGSYSENAAGTGLFAIGNAAGSATKAVTTISSGTLSTGSGGVRFGASSGTVPTSGGTLNLNGGTLTTNKIFVSATGASTVNFNGGTLQASATNNTNFMTGLATAAVLAGGAKIDTNTKSITIVQALTSGAVSDGGLTKLGGSGTLTLSGANTYNGATTINVGTLTLGATGSIANSSKVSIASGATFNPTLAGTFNIASGKSLEGAGTATGAFNVNGSGTLRAGLGLDATGTLSIGGDLTASNLSTLEFALGLAGAHSTLARSSGTWTFDTAQQVSLLNYGIDTGLTYSGIITGLAGSFDASAWHAVNNPSGFQAVFNYNSGTNAIDLSFVAVPEPSSYALVMSGALVLLLVRRRFRRS